jgi:DNA-binding NarL/FixJ family response regulator
MSHANSPVEPRKFRIIHVDDHALFRRGLKALIETEPDLVVCADAATHLAGLAAVIGEDPDLVIVDLTLQSSDGLALVRDLKREMPLLPVLVLSMHDEPLHAERAFSAGARGYVIKYEMDSTVLVAIRRLLAGETYTSPALCGDLSKKLLTGDLPGGTGSGDAKSQLGESPGDPRNHDVP